MSAVTTSVVVTGKSGLVSRQRLFHFWLRWLQSSSCQVLFLLQWQRGSRCQQIGDVVGLPMTWQAGTQSTRRQSMRQPRRRAFNSRDGSRGKNWEQDQKVDDLF